MTIPTVKFESREIFADDVIGRNYEIITFISKYFNLRRSRVAIFVDIIKTVTMFIKKIFQDSEKVKRIKNNVSKYNLCLYFLVYQKLLISGKNC